MQEWWQNSPPLKKKMYQLCQMLFWENSFIPSYNGSWTPAAVAVTSCYGAAVIICSLIVKWALMKRAESPHRRLCYWRNGSEQQGQVGSVKYNKPSTSNWPPATLDSWFYPDHKQLFSFKEEEVHSYVLSNRITPTKMITTKTKGLLPVYFWWCTKETNIQENQMF